MKSNRIRIIIILGTIAMSGIIVFQVFWFTKTWTLKEKQFDQTVHYALNKVAHEIYKYNNMEPPGYNPVNLIHPGYYIVNIKSEIDVNVLEYYLKREFDNFHIIVDFEYGVYDCRTDKMLYGDYVCATENCQKSFSNKLPTYDEFTYYFGVNFPTVDRYLLSEMSVWTIFSTLLLLVILFFSYTLYIIFKQKRLSEQQREFINNMTHEFKTPISTINIAVDVLLNPEFMKDRNKVIDYAKIIKQENNRLNSQVERVLGMAQIEKRSFSLRKEYFDLHDLIEEVVYNLKIKNPKKQQLDVFTRLDSPISKIYADKLHLTNILFNLFDNAVKYSGDNLKIHVKTQKVGNNILLIFNDNGKGIGKEFHGKIFRKFYRVPTGDLHDVKGFGLGLYYVKSIAKKHKWKVSFESEPGKGTSFYISIPLQDGL